MKLAYYRTRNTHFRRRQVAPLRGVSSTRILATTLDDGQVTIPLLLSFIPVDQNAVVNVLTDTEGNLEILFDGNADDEATLVIVKGKEVSVLLEPLSGALRDQDLVILSASVDASEALFRITDQNGSKVRISAVFDTHTTIS